MLMDSGELGAAPAASHELLSISDTEAATGVSREVLRMWERRYGFPTPLRDDRGERRYDPAQIEKLRLIRLLQGCGFRAGKLVDMDQQALEQLLQLQAPRPDLHSPVIREELLQALKSADAHEIREYLTHRMLKLGLHDFVLNFMPYANFIVGDEWQKGRLEIHEEHLYTEEVQAALNVAISALLPPLPQAPKIMLCTAPGEPHTLGIAMVEALLRLERVNVTCFGPEMPAKVIAQAALKHGVDVVGLSFSSSYPSNRLAEFLELLRVRLPARVQIWAGGAATQLSRRHVEGVRFISGLQSLRGLVLELEHQRGVRISVTRH